MLFLYRPTLTSIHDHWEHHSLACWTVDPTSLLDLGGRQHCLAPLACTCVALISVAVVTAHSCLRLPLCIFTWPFYGLRFGEGNDNPLQCSCLESRGRGSLVGCRLWGHTESDTTERLPFHFSLSCIGEGNGNPLQCSCLENPRGGGAWWAAIYGVAQSRTQLK